MSNKQTEEFYEHLEENKEELQAARLLGKRGGTKTAQRGSEYYREIGKRGAQKRWQTHLFIGVETTDGNKWCEKHDKWCPVDAG